MAPARSLAEALIPFLFLLAVLAFGLFFLGTPRRAPEPEVIKLTPLRAGDGEAPPQVRDEKQAGTGGKAEAR